MASIDVNRSSVYALRKELQAKGWAKFNGDNVTELYGFKSPKNQTASKENKAVSSSSAPNQSENSDSPKNQTEKSENSDSPVQKIRLVSPKIQTFQSKKSDSHIRKNQQIEPAKEINPPLPAAKQGEKQPDPLFAIFAEQFQQHQDCPYLHKKADFVQLAQLRKLSTESNWPLTEARFQQAVDHYFQSEIGNPTLADLCARFSAFFKSALDRFGKAVVTSNKSNGYSSAAPLNKSEQVLQHNLALLEELNRDQAASKGNYIEAEVIYA